jgi:hypothetical protein
MAGGIASGHFCYGAQRSLRACGKRLETGDSQNCKIFLSAFSDIYSSMTEIRAGLVSRRFISVFLPTALLPLAPNAS